VLPSHGLERVREAMIRPSITATRCNHLQVKSHMPSFLIRMILSSALATVFSTAWAANPAPQALLEQYRCTICHAERDAGAGPAWVDIAKHYRGIKQANKLVTDKIRSGARSGGPWHMPPHPEVSRADASTMARFILSTKIEPVDTPTDRRQPP